MFKRITTMIAKDLRTATRDQLSLYIVISPILLGLLMALLMPLFEDPQPQFVTTAALASEDRDALAACGELEIARDRAALEQRVRDRDDVTGVVPGQSGALEFVIEGNEPEQLRDLAWAIVDHERRVRSGERLTEVELVSLDTGSTDLRLALGALLGYTVPVLLGLILGFTILEEKTSKTYLIYAVAPLRFGEYLAAKLGLLTAVSIVMIVPAIGIPLGFELSWLRVELMMLASLPFAASFGLLLGVFANDQLGAIALTKGLSPVWTSLPILGFVLPNTWLWTQFPFANHWGVQGLFHALSDGAQLWMHAGLTLATGLPVLLITTWLLRRKLGFT